MHEFLFSPGVLHDPPIFLVQYRVADKYLAQPGRKQSLFLSEWREFPLALCLAGKNPLITASD